MALMNVLTPVSNSSSPGVSKMRNDVFEFESVKAYSVACSVQPARYGDVNATSRPAIKLITELLPTPISPKRITFLGLTPSDANRNK